MVHLPGIDTRLTRLNRRLTERRTSGVLETLVADAGALLEVLDSRFGLGFPAGTCFPYEEEPGERPRATL